MLRLDNVTSGYGEALAIRDVSLEIKAGEVVAIVGANGNGKSTTLRTISGMLRPTRGEIRFEDERIDTLPPHVIVRKTRIAHVPEGKQLFGKLSVVDNMMLGAYILDSKDGIQKLQDDVLQLFPRLAERRNQRVDTLSGGEQQMVAIARGLMLRPKLLMLDEPSLGLMPTLITSMWKLLMELRQRGLTILLVEQNVRKALELADRGYVIQNGRIVLSGTGSELLGNDLVRQAYLGR